MSSGPLRVLDADPAGAVLDSDLDFGFDSPGAETPLLQDYEQSRDTEHPPPAAPQHRYYVWVISISLCAVFLVQIGEVMLQSPLVRALEDILCRKYYESMQPLGTRISLPIPEQDCKMPAVQGQLAMLRGWDSAFSCIPTLLLALPYGYIADTYGRKIVLVLGLLGLILGTAWTLFIIRFESVMDVRWIWAGNIFLCIGGGGSVINAAVFAMFADVTPEEKRAAIFFRFTAASMLSPLIGVPFAWYLMKDSTLLAMSVGLGFACGGLFLVLFLPETLDRAGFSDKLSYLECDDLSPEDEGLLPTSKPMSISGVVKGLNFVFGTPALRTLSITFIISPVILNSMSFLVQFASERYHWSIADSSFITPFSAISTFVMLVVILPVFYSVLGSRFRMHATMRDLVVARGSLIFLVLGCFAIGLAPVPGLLIAGTGILSLGAGFMCAVRSLVTSFVHTDQVSRLFGVVAIIETVGTLVTSPLISKAFGWGMDLGGMWSGMVFMLAGVMTLILGMPVWAMRPPKPEEDVHG